MIETEVQIEQKDPRLGRNILHDDRSRRFAMGLPINKDTWRSRSIRMYEPIPNPNQPVGCCTGCAKSTQFNAINNRVLGQVLDMDTALDLYSRATTLDPWYGSYPPDDTGSSGLASAKAAQQLGLGLDYRWLFGGADEVVQAVMMGEAISIGSYWYWDMFEPDSQGRIRPTGGVAGGHQYVARGYDVRKDWVLIRCWWGEFRDAWISRADLHSLLMDDGDAHWQRRTAL